MVQISFFSLFRLCTKSRSRFNYIRYPGTTEELLQMLGLEGWRLPRDARGRVASLHRDAERASLLGSSEVEEEPGSQSRPRNKNGCLSPTRGAYTPKRRAR